MADPKQKVACGFIGMGSQGAPIARRMIDAGFPTTLWARRPETLEPYRETAARYAATIAELGAQAQHVGLCVVTDNDVRQVCDQLIPAMRPGSRIAIHSTVHPNTCRAVEAQAAERGVRVVDAPVSGGPIVAQAGELTVMLGGDPQVIAEAMPVFESFGRMIVRLGGVGAGQHAKLINNALLAAHMGLAHSAFAAGASVGIERAALAELVSASSGRSYGLEACARLPSLTAFAHGAALLAKDMRLLGEVLGQDDPAFGALNGAATPFLDMVLA